MGNADRNEKLANELRDFLLEHDLALDTRIYFNGKVYEYNSGTEGKYRVIEGIDPKEYIEHANKDTLAMSFEGYLYDVLNYGNSIGLQESFDKIFKDNGCYYELGNAWNLIVYYE